MRISELITTLCGVRVSRATSARAICTVGGSTDGGDRVISGLAFYRECDSLAD